MRLAVPLPLVICLSALAAQQATDPPTKQPAEPVPVVRPMRFTDFPVPEAPPLDVAVATKDAIAAILRRQEGEGGDQWPYEGVYREDRGQLPVGYRVGGTAITCLGLLAAPGYRDDTARQEALQRGLRFVLATLDVPRMQEEFVGTYDVRGWGHAYALQLLLHLQDQQTVPPDLVAPVAAKVRWLVGVLVDSAIPEAGGWNYSRPQGYKSPTNRASTFMTAPTLLALFHAAARGHEVAPAVVAQALDALDRARSKPGGYAYGAPAESQGAVEEASLSMMDKTAGAAARATACELALLLGGRGDRTRLQASIETFFAHWDDLAVRKSQTGTHVKPYGIAPYYFLFGHVYAALAIEQLPAGEAKDGFRQRLLAVLAKSREADGGWNDRQFDRSAGYGTSLALLTMHMRHLPQPSAWVGAAAATKGR
jgi:hypothetical protein